LVEHAVRSWLAAELDSWTVVLKNWKTGVTSYPDSCSALVGRNFKRGAAIESSPVQHSARKQPRGARLK